MHKHHNFDAWENPAFDTLFDLFEEDEVEEYDGTNCADELEIE